jgi:hypothetical protein
VQQQIQALGYMQINTFLAVSSQYLCSSYLFISFTAPDDELRPILTLYFQLGMSDTDITTSVMDHFDPARYGIRYVPRYIKTCQHDLEDFSAVFTQSVADAKNGA